MTPEQFKTLLAGYYAGTLSTGDKQELNDLLHDPERQQELQSLFPESLGSLELENPVSPEAMGLIYEQVLLNNGIEEEQAVQHEIRNWNWRRLAVAASILLIITAGGYFFFFHTNKNPSVAALPNDIKAPVSNRARITLGNGQQIDLDSAINGRLAIQGGSQLIKLSDGQIAYRPGQQASGELLYNTLTNPRGSKVIALTLSDGTKVWLNAESSLKYPAFFMGAAREVKITGEAYFEVFKNASKPFKVDINGKASIEVLGTHFNINSYEDEGSIKATLLEGRIRIGVSANGNNGGEKQATLKPGQQARLLVADNSNNGGNQIKITNEADTGQVMAWRNGVFAFTDADLAVVMRQLERWYDVKVEYAGSIPSGQFNGEIGRTLTLSQVLEGLAEARVKYKINGNKIIILPN